MLNKTERASKTDCARTSALEKKRTAGTRCSCPPHNAQVPLGVGPSAGFPAEANLLNYRWGIVSLDGGF